MLKILVFGCSGGYVKLKKYLDDQKTEVIGFLDNNENLHGEFVDSSEVFEVRKVVELKYDFILIASINYQKDMLDQLLGLGIDYKKIILPAFLYRKTAVHQIINQYNQYRKETAVFKDEFVMKEMNYGIATMNKTLEPPVVNFIEYPEYSIKGLDIVRLATVDLISREIKENKISGAIAELGVYKGDFSRYLGDLYPTEKMVLFDTFDGFSEKDIKVEKLKGFSNAKVGRFSDTSVEEVLCKITNRNRVSVIKGYFPDTTETFEDIKYAFVSIDVDLFEPILSGLKYFYERLSVGGYIIVHDYNFPTYSGVKAAVKEFTKQTGIYGVPIPDYHGSILFVKNKR